MAENKVVNATQLEADLTSIADAIRAKAELSDSFVFPSGFVDAITNLQGLPSGFSAFTSGTFTPTSDLESIEIEHGLGVAPNFYYLIAVSSMDVDKRIVFSEEGFKKTWTYSGNTYSGGCLTNWKYSPTASVYPGNFSTMKRTYNASNYLTDTIIKTQGASVNAAYFGSGTTYLWICGVIDGMV